jgi:hypothetical protein
MRMLFGSHLAAILLILSAFGFAQTSDLKSSACTFDDGKQISVRYSPAANTDHRLPEGKVWSPGGSPMYLFTSAPLVVGTDQIPVGAYSMFFVPQKNNWILILNKNVASSSHYDQHQDLLRLPMQVATLSSPQAFTVVFGHVAPKQCNMRIYESKLAAWEEFKEK